MKRSQNLLDVAVPKLNELKYIKWIKYNKWIKTHGYF